VCIQISLTGATSRIKMKYLCLLYISLSFVHVEHSRIVVAWYVDQ